MADRNIKINITVNTDQSKNEVGALTSEVNKLKKELDTLNNNAKKAQDAVRSFGSATGSASGSVKALRDSTDQANLSFGKMASAVGLGVVGAKAFSVATQAITGTLKDAITEANLFNQKILAIETILPRGTRVTNTMREALKQLAETFGTTSATQAESFYTILSAGVDDAANAMKLLEQSNRLASGGLASQASTIDLLTTVYNVYGKEVATTSQAADSLFISARNGKTNIEELASSIGSVLPRAKQMGMSFDEVGSIIATFTNRGYSTAQAVVMLNQLFTQLAKNSSKLGPTMDSNAVQTEGLAVVMERLKTRVNGSDAALTKLLTQQNAIRGATILMNGGMVEVNKNLEDYATKAGIAEEASKKMINEDTITLWKRLGTSILNTTDELLSLSAISNASAGFLLNIFEAPKVKSELDVLNEQIAELEKTIEEITARTKSGDFTLSDYIVDAFGYDNLKGFNDLLEETKKKRDAITASSATPLAGEVSTTGEKPATSGKADASTLLDPDREARRLQKIKDDRADFNAQIAQQEAEFNALQDQEKANRELAEIENEFARNEREIEINSAHKTALLEAEYNYQVSKNSTIQDAENQRLANQLALDKKDTELYKLKIDTKKKLDENRKKESEKLDKENLKKSQEFAKANVDIIENSGQLISAMMVDGSKEQFLVEKASAVLSAIISTQAAMAKALAIDPTGALSTRVGIAGGINVATILATTFKGLQKFADGGWVGQNGKVNGASFAGDSITARLNAGELVLNQREQGVIAQLLGSGGGFGNNAVIVELLQMIAFNAQASPAIYLNGTLVSDRLNNLNNLRLN